LLQDPECKECDGVNSEDCGCAMRATTVAYNQAYLYEDGQLVRAGQPVQLGTGCRETQHPESAGRRWHSPSCMTDDSVVLGPMVLTRCADDGAGDNTARDPFCVSKALRVLTELPIQFKPDVVFDTLPTTWANSKWTQSGYLQRPSKWGYLELLANGRFTSNAVDLICNLAAEGGDRLVLRVHVVETNTSLHCIAVLGDRGLLVDPADMVEKPLCAKSFSDLGIDKIRAGYRLNKHK